MLKVTNPYFEKYTAMRHTNT